MFLINNNFFLTLKFSNEKNDLFLNVNIQGFNFSQTFKVKWDLPFKFYPWRPMIKFEGWVLISIGRAFILSALQRWREKICTLIEKYKLTKPFHTKKCKKQILFFQRLLWKHACMWWRGLSQLNPCKSLHVWV